MENEASGLLGKPKSESSAFGGLNFKAVQGNISQFGEIIKPAMKAGITAIESRGRQAADRVPPEMQTQIRELIKPCFAEFLGLFFFVFIGSMSVGTDSPVAVAVAHGLTITALIVALGQISGGHFNPAITVSIFVAGKMQMQAAVAYGISQLFGGLMGACFVRASLTNDSFGSAAIDMNPEDEFIGFNGGALQLNTSVAGAGGGVIIELILTFIVCLVVLVTMVESNGQSREGPLVVGITIAVCILAGFASTGGCMNPARAFGPAIAVSVYNPHVWKYHFIYWLGPVLGGAFAGLFYRFLKRNGWQYLHSSPSPSNMTIPEGLPNSSSSDDVECNNYQSKNGYETLPEYNSGKKGVTEDQNIFEIDEKEDK